VFAGCQALALACFGLLAVRWYHHERQRLRDDLEAAVRGFVEAPDAETPSPLAAFVDHIALLLAARLVQQVKAMLAGVESGAAKGEQLAMFEAAAEQSPWIGLIGGMLPKRIRNQLMKNPQMIGALSRLGSGGNGTRTDAAAAPRKHHD
jgi:hypothetical protein